MAMRLPLTSTPTASGKAIAYEPAGKAAEQVTDAEPAGMTASDPLGLEPSFDRFPQSEDEGVCPR
jgi:hypothetical protein